MRNDWAIDDICKYLEVEPFDGAPDGSYRPDN